MVLSAVFYRLLRLFCVLLFYAGILQISDNRFQLNVNSQYIIDCAASMGSQTDTDLITRLFYFL